MHRFFFLVVLGLSLNVFSQDSLRVDSLNVFKEIVIFHANSRVPITFQNINQKEIENKSFGQEPSFWLAETPSITCYSDAGGTQGYSYFRLRGIDQTRINMTLDGVPLNEPEDQGAYFSNYPDLFNSVSKIQIQRGVGISKNGVASFGGSLDLSSPNLSDSSKLSFGLGYGSFNSCRAFGEFNSGIKNKKALYIRASQIYSDGYKYNSANNSQSIFISNGLHLKKSFWKINMLFGQQQNKLAWLGVSDSLIQLDRRTNANVNEKDKFIQSLFQLQNTWRLSSTSSFQSSVYYTYLKGNYDFNLNTFLGLPSSEELYNYAFQSNLIGFFSNYTFSNKQFTWTSGIHANSYQRQHIGSERNFGELYKNRGFKNELSVFSKLEYRYKKLTFYGDIQNRYTEFSYKGSVKLEKLSWNFINPKTGISLNLKENCLIYYSLGTVGREPTRNDIFGGNDDLLQDSIGNAILFNVNPEKVVDQELGIRFQKQKMHVNFNLYFMDFKNEIVLIGKFGPNGLALTNNVDKSFRSGCELSLSYPINKYFSIKNNSSYNYSSIREQEVTFRPILTQRFIINQELEFSKKGFSFNLGVRFQDNSFVDFANTEKIKSYFALNSKLKYEYKKFQLIVFLNNLTNAKYFNNAYLDYDGKVKYFVQAPLSIFTSIIYNF